MFRNHILIQQRDITDCGAACLASIAAYYRLFISVSNIRLHAGTDRLGTNLLGLIEAANALGFRAKGARGDIASLSTIPLPCIAHIILPNKLHHYVVIYTIQKKAIKYMDPSDGKMHKSSIDNFIKIWSGAILLMIPDAQFEVSGKKINNLSRFIYLIQPHKINMIHALVGALIYTILGLSFSVYLQKIIDQVLVSGDTGLLRILSIGMIIILILQFFLGNIKSIIALQTGQQIDIRLLFGYYRHLLSLPSKFFDSMRTGEILSRLNDAVKIRLFINDIALGLVVNFFILTFSILLMFIYNKVLALITLLIIPFYFLIYWINNRVNKKWQRKLMEQSAELESQLVESVNVIATIKQFGLEEFIGHKTENKFMQIMNTVYRTGLYGISVGTSTDFITKLFTILLIWTGSYYVTQQQLTPGELLSFYALIGYFTGPVSSLIDSNKHIQEASIAADRLFEIIDLDKEQVIKNQINFSSELMGDIQFNDVHFRYGSRSNVFLGLSLLIPKGKSTAIVGQSGSGKSTLLSLLQNLYSLQSGNITIGEIDLKHFNNSSLRNLIAVVPQQIDLFADSIINNIAVGEYEPDLQKVLSISRLLGIHDFIEKLPQGYNTILNEQGENLSGGQRQRIAIARALYRNPEVLILDEATSSLDAISEQQIQAGLDWFQLQGKTIIIIAHKISTIKNCDQIIVLENGYLTEQGTHESLIQLNGAYAKLIQ